MKRLVRRVMVALSCVTIASLLSFISTTSHLRNSVFSHKKGQSMLHDDVGEPHSVLTSLRSSKVGRIVGVGDVRSNVVIVGDMQRRRADISERYNDTFQEHFQVRVSFQGQLSSEVRVGFIRDYFKNKTQLYLPSDRRRSAPQFVSYSDHNRTLPEGDFSRFSSVTNGSNEPLLCYTTGSNMTASSQQGQCVCQTEWRGRHCSIPSLVDPTAVTDSLRSRPRRVVYTLALNQEVELLLTILSSMWDVVDLFVIGEMNMTHYGDPRPWFIRELLEGGAFRPFEKKMFYVPCTFPDPRRCLEHNTFECENSKFTCLHEKGIGSIIGLRDDDLIMYTDTDEFVPATFVHALRYHNSSYQHFSVNLKWFVYSCVWRTESGVVGPMGFAATAGFARKYSLLAVRGRLGVPEPVMLMTIGAVGAHCSWCFDVAGMQLKLISAVNSDFPRWGDFAAMFEKEFIEFLISRGTFFDLESVLLPVEWSSLQHDAFRDEPFCTRYGFNHSQPAA